MSSLKRMLSVIDAFTESAPVWTVDGLAAAYGYTRATTYRYVGELCDAGLLTRVAHGAYALGPRIIELDRQMQRSDPLLAAAEPVWPQLLRPDREQVALLCGLFRDEVLCIGQAARHRGIAVSYTRGRPMPLFRGATAKAILAWLPERRLARLYAEKRSEIRKAGLGASPAAFLSALKAIRSQGHCITFGEVDPGVVGVAVPVFEEDGAVIGSLSLVFPAERFPRRRLPQLVAKLAQGAQRVQANLVKLAARRSEA
jgi:DNA-binding IclR family transcriptional regulator